MYYVEQYIEAIQSRIADTHKKITAGESAAPFAGNAIAREADQLELERKRGAVSTLELEVYRLQNDEAHRRDLVEAQAATADADNADAMRATMGSGAPTGNPLALTLKELTVMRWNMEAMKK